MPRASRLLSIRFSILSRLNTPSVLKQRLFTSLFLLLASVSALLAEARIQFAKTTHDFGTIQEKNGDVTTKFEFTNTGDSPLLITRATATCGCTSPEYPKKPLRPGEKGEITVTYHAKGRPGTFDKSIYVYSNDAKQEKMLLTITGNVISSTGVRETFTEELGGGLRLKTTTLNFFDVYPGRTNRTRTLAVYNEGDKPIKLAFRSVPSHIYIECEPELIQPKSEGRVLVTYLAEKVKDWGTRNDLFDIFVKGSETRMQNNHIMVMADIWEDFSDLSKEQRQNAPEIEASNTIIDFERGSNIRSREITLRNTGYARLTIRKVQNDEPEVIVTALDKTTLKPGETAKLKVTYDPSKSVKRNLNQHLTIISNDPSNSRIIINIQGGK